ncbi:conserved exported protein of unknown function [Nitrospira japonica]|uniref:Secreted protein n=1 Tax=Nitrospira japonica TaxID=1325564 RepID=A0A1W1I0J4_9BACT|nr:hypothetical protein [Nitrospira japonica]SLM46511.1 conserved exported protein of unknown function [Nitrospira japonica]
MRISEQRAIVFAAFLGLMAGGCASDGTTGSGNGATAGSTPSSAPAAAPSSAPAASSAAGTAPKFATAEAAAKSVQTDTLRNCLAMIPANATPGAKQVAEESCKRDEQLRANVVGMASTKSGDRAASGTQGDTLDACMARIPKDASAGQRMLAEQSCQRDQANR